MISLDDHAGNVVATVALFVCMAAVLCIARAALLVFVLPLLFAYLLEPAVTFVQNRSPLRKGNRAPSVLSNLRNPGCMIAFERRARQTLTPPVCGNTGWTAGCRDSGPLI